MRRPQLIRIALVGAALVALIAGGIWWRGTTDPDERLRRGREALQQGDQLAAELYADQLDATEQGHLLRAELAITRKNPAQALQHVNHIPRESPFGVEAGFLAAKCLIMLRRPRKAEPVLSFVLSCAPDHAEAHRWAGVLYYDQGDFPRAVDHLRRTSELNTEDAAALRLAALIYHELENHREAVPLYLESLRRNPHPRGEEAIRTELAVSLLKLLDPSGALEALEGMNGPDANAARVESLIALGRDDAARQVLTAALESSPEHAGLLWCLAQRQRAIGDHQAAVATLQRLLKRDPHDLRARHLIAQACEALGRSRESAEHLTQAKETESLMEQVQLKNQEASKNPWDPEVRYHLADLCDRLGRTGMAAMWRRAAQACAAPLR